MPFIMYVLDFWPYALLFVVGGGIAGFLIFAVIGFFIYGDWDLAIEAGGVISGIMTAIYLTLLVVGLLMLPLQAYGVIPVG